MSAEGVDDKAVTFLSQGEEIPFHYKHKTQKSQILKTQSACITTRLGVKLFIAILVALTLIHTTQEILTIYKPELITEEEKKTNKCQNNVVFLTPTPNNHFLPLGAVIT